jgi:sulfur carrier protein ThiS
MLDAAPAHLGHNIADMDVNVEVRFFNAIARYAGPQGLRQQMTVPAGTTVGELADRLGVPRKELFLVLVNGRDITPGLVGDDIKDYHVLDDGDVIAFSGAVPYSYGYGSPVV